MPRRRNYPAHGSEVLDNSIRYRRATLRAVRRFARTRSWRGSLEARRVKFGALHRTLCEIYGRQTRLEFRGGGGDSGSSSYSPGLDLITLRGRLSVVTYLHEFTHALGRDERAACRWSLNLFKTCFPRSFARCRFEGHVLYRRA